MKQRLDVKILFVLCCFGFSAFNVPPAAAFSGLKVNVEIVKADKSGKVDPELKALAKEVSPLLNFTGFSLLKETSTSLKIEEKAEIVLSPGRVLELQFLGFEDDKARLLARILEKDKETFRTVLLLVDKGNVLIGGPPHEDGVLLLRVGGEFKD